MLSVTAGETGLVAVGFDSADQWRVGLASVDFSRRVHMVPSTRRTQLRRGWVIRSDAERDRRTVRSRGRG